MRPVLRTAALALLFSLPAIPARAVLDIEDRGPTLSAGNFAMRVTNVGVLGNPFFDVGRSFDPSFEYPRGSGHEALHAASLWVGARTASGPRVSGGPMLEWRPSLDPDDRVLTAWGARPGTVRLVDDDGDGRIDEELLNGRDDDGDGEVDEDLGVGSTEMMAAEFTDDRPEAVNYGYPNGEQHQPLGLTARQEAYAWAVPGYDAIAGIQYTITNHTDQVLHDVWLGVLADLDSRRRDEPAGHLNDKVVWRSWSLDIPEGVSAFGAFVKTCVTRLGGNVPIVVDGVPGSGLPAVAIMPFTHTTDPLAFINNFLFPGAREAREAARAPARDTTFRFSIFANDLPAGQGGVPIVDSQRYDALQGLMPQAPPDHIGDPVVLLSCGPFKTLGPGQSLRFAVGIVAAPDPDSLPPVFARAALLQRGTRLNLQPDVASNSPSEGRTGINGHEVCMEPPPGLEFDYDPNCPQKFVQDPAYQPLPGFPPGTDTQVTYRPGNCIWTDADCDACTGLDGKETVFPWLDPGDVPPPPQYHVTPGDHEITVAWDNTPEILLGAGFGATQGASFAGYRVYRLSDWTRSSILPPPDHWQMIAAFGPDTANGERPLATVTDSTVDYDLIQYGRRHYPIGRYRLTDTGVLDGFDYHYLLTTVTVKRTLLGGHEVEQRYESPLIASIDSVVSPRLTARPNAGQVWVVPNPYRGNAPWDRPPVPGDPFGRHIDFFGLPRAHSVIKVWTVAGDLVAQIDHDGTTGSGEASWNLISRNGQDVESGIYLFTVDSPLGHAIGRFVIVR